jgi:sortase A
MPPKTSGLTTDEARRKLTEFGPNAQAMIVPIHPSRKSRTVRSALWRVSEWPFLIGGFLAVGYAAYTYAAQYIYQVYEMESFDRTLQVVHDASAAPALKSAAEPKTAATELIGKIVIPRLEISAIVKEGVDKNTLRLAVGHIPSTVLPGQAGNVGLAAHRDTLFRNLKDVREDDVITLITLKKTYIYRVVSLKTVNPSETSVLAGVGDEKTLTLVTCYPFYLVGHAPKRFVVRARQVANIPRTQAF